MDMNKVLIVDDDENVRLGLSSVLGACGLVPESASGGRQALESVRKESPAAVLLDLRMPEMDGAETLQELKKTDPGLPVIILTAHGDIPTAVELIKHGAYDFLTKPPDMENLIAVLERAIEKVKAEREAQSRLEGKFEWLGKSAAMRRIIRQIHQVASSELSVVIQGETGTGKSVVARAIHSISKRAEKPLVIVDIGVIPETLVESELFGHAKGAFTGADRDKKGYFEMAHGGTVFMDELENMSSFVQGKLLGAVEEKRICPLGSSKPVEIDVRVIAATNADLAKDVKEKKFRQDLFYRLGEFIITLPALRERKEDIPYIARRFLLECSDGLDKRIREISDDALELMLGYHWPGNVRELKSLIKRAVLLAKGEVLRPEHIEFLIDEGGYVSETIRLFPLRAAIRDLEEKAIQQALELSGGNKSKAASLLDIDYKTLLSRIKEYGL